MKKHICTVKGCPFEGGYCRTHLAWNVREEKPIAKQSDKMKEAMKQYSKKATAFKRQHPFCQAKIDGICTRVTTDVHHKLGRNSKEDLLNEKYWLATCRDCHQVITENSAWAIQQGFSISRHAKRDAA